MQRSFGHLRAEVIEAERAKFTAPLLLLHGLWADPSVWRRCMGYWAHRGWQCIALERHAGTASIDGARAEIEAALAAFAAAPIIIGHDLGGLLGLLVAARARAVVALAPLVPGPIALVPRALQQAGTWSQRLRARALSAPGAYRWSTGGDTREPGALLHDLASEVPGLGVIPRSVPSAVWVAADDPITPPDAARALAARVGAEMRLCIGGGHALPASAGWEERVTDIHRWIVQRLGRDVLADYEEPED